MTRYELDLGCRWDIYLEMRFYSNFISQLKVMNCYDVHCESRLYSFSKPALQVKEAFVAQVKKLKVGNPFEEDTFIGPMISEKDAMRIEDWVKEAVQKGGKLLAGGKRNGALMEPTVIEDVPMEANARKEEIFGPVVLFYKYR